MRVNSMDDRLKHWLIDRAIQQARRDDREGRPISRTVGWKSIYEYLEDLGLNSTSGKNYSDARKSFDRLSGLAITVEIESGNGNAGMIIPFLENWYLPKSLSRGQAAKELSGQQGLDLQRYGFTISKPIFEHAMNHFVAIPRQLWRSTQGGAQQSAMLLWAFIRAYAAQGPSLVPWDALREQLWYDESTPHRIKARMKTVATLLQAMWPGSRMSVEDQGVRFDRAETPLLEDDPLRGRQRKRPDEIHPRVDASLVIARDEAMRKRRQAQDALWKSEEELRKLRAKIDADIDRKRR